VWRAAVVFHFGLDNRVLPQQLNACGDQRGEVGGVLDDSEHPQLGSRKCEPVIDKNPPLAAR
jgi:hypothetical protein